MSNFRKAQHPKLSFEDALWSRITVLTRSMTYGKCAPMALVPFGDMLASGGRKGNLQSICDISNGTITWRPTRHIEAGEELTQNWSVSDEPNALSVFSQYGFVPDHTPAEHWSEADCTALRTADLSEGGALMKGARKLVEQSCAEPAKPADEGAKAISSTSVSQSVAPLPLLTPWSNAGSSSKKPPKRC